MNPWMILSRVRLNSVSISVNPITPRLNLQRLDRDVLGIQSKPVGLEI